KNWIFDMDGTLTIAVHDFDAIRNDLGIPQGKRILEAIEEMPSEQAETFYRRFEEIEMELACRTQPQNSARELLSILHQNGTNLGILTRNNTKNAKKTLLNCGFSDFFESKCIIGRESVKPKPHPEGIHQLLDLWNASPDETIMVGDHPMDIEAGLQAGTFTIFISPNSHTCEHSGLTISNLNEILLLLVNKI
ncbi:MAG: HAD family hydrolase, partial [Desulfobacterales bacterium]|nr:HAD family hydrolase [Desulfobacterales bacterium]